MKLEVCVDCIESARAARTGGADRLEVCSALDLGGLTPSGGLLEQCLELDGIDVVVMIRPHAGGFCYAAESIDTMLRDIRLAKQWGAHGVVLGAMLPDGQIDRTSCRQLIDAARPLSVTFHRAFDVIRNPLEAVEQLIALGVDRLLTSGQAASAIAGVDLIRRLVDRAGKELTVMAGGGVTAADLADLVRVTGVRELHASASELVTIATGAHAQSFIHPVRWTSAEKVRGLVAAMRACVDEQPIPGP